MKVSAEVEMACSLAQREAISRRHDVMAVEHLLYGPFYDDATAKVVKKSGGKVDKLKRSLERILNEEFKAVSGDVPGAADADARVPTRAAARRDSRSVER